jgi:hypothetical protein
LLLRCCARPEFCRTFNLSRNPGGLLDPSDNPRLLLDLGECLLKPSDKIRAIDL